MLNSLAVQTVLFFDLATNIRLAGFARIGVRGLATDGYGRHYYLKSGSEWPPKSGLAGAFVTCQVMA